ncbi:nucleoside/nucleotide kinase family protein [Leucobacter tenebrionis]|uniref:hypothetical protein n=1 Tax=Leucobacter tenebrionis TaxID=2873270 RepID=UPI001CA7AB66|nr:hypothetical protein [Leucobacter tenebrionis]QZY53066.1 hypothetical protein KVY00_06475 [Leucobacter tenebrionis]
MNTNPSRVVAGVEALGATVLVRAVEPIDERLLEALLAPWSDAGMRRSPRSPHGEPMPGAPSVALHPLVEAHLDEAASRLSTEVTLAALRDRAGTHLLLHAAGVARADGAVLAIIGPSGRGKTTTARQLAVRLGYVTDEAVAIARDGSVLPYRKPLSVVTAGRTEKVQIAPTDLGLLPLPDAGLGIAGLVLLERAGEGEEASSVEPVGLAEALVEIAQQTSYLAELTDPLVAIARTAEATGGVRRLRVGVPDRIPEAIDDLYAAGECEPWEQILPIRDSSPAGPHVPSVGYAPAERVLDAVECATGTVVLTADREVRLLTGIAPLVWRGLCEGDDWARLERRAVERFGAPPHGTVREALVEVCDALVDAAVLERDERGE